MSTMPPIFNRSRAFGVALVALSGIAQALAGGVAALATRDVFQALGSGHIAAPYSAIGLILAAGIVIAGLRVLERIAAERVGHDYAADLRKTLFRHFSRMPPRELVHHRAGALAIRFVGDLTAVRNWVSLGIARLFSAIFVVPGAIAVLFLLRPELALIGGLLIIGSFLIMALVAGRLGPLHRRLRRRRARLAVDMSERVPLAPELRLQGRDRTEARRLEKGALRLRSAAIERVVATASLRAVPEVGVAMAASLFLAAAFHQGITGGEIAGALAVLGILATPLRNLAGLWDHRRAWDVARGKCVSILNAPVAPPAKTTSKRPDSGKPPAKLQTGLAFDAVESSNLHQITATAGRGEKIVIVGGNGAGKSSLLDLAAGLDWPQQGTVRLGGRDPVALRREQRSRKLCHVGSRSPILKGSLRRALTMGLTPRPADPAILTALEEYGLKAACDRLGGLDGQLAEGGRNLSSGEARRIHIARAALAKPDLMLLDEPDDTLDVNGRQAILRLINRTEATLLVVTHDLALARHFDRMWYMQAGQIVADGPPVQLFSQDGPARDFGTPSKAA